MPTRHAAALYAGALLAGAALVVGAADVDRSRAIAAFVAIAAIGALLLGWQARHRQRRQRTLGVLREVAEALGLKAHAGSSDTPRDGALQLGPHLLGHRHQHPVELRVWWGGRDPTRTQGAFGPTLPCDHDLVIGPPQVLERLGLGRAHVVSTGDAAFDERITVTGDALTALAWLSADRRAAIARVMPDHDGFVQHRRVRSVTPGAPSHVGQEVDRIRALTDLARDLDGDDDDRHVRACVQRALADPIAEVRRAALDAITDQLGTAALREAVPAALVGEVARLALPPAEAGQTRRRRDVRGTTHRLAVSADEAISAAILLDDRDVLRAWVRHADDEATAPRTSMFGPPDASPTDARRARALHALLDAEATDILALARAALDANPGPALLDAAIEVATRSGGPEAAAVLARAAQLAGRSQARRILDDTARRAPPVAVPVLRALAEGPSVDIAVEAVARLVPLTDPEDTRWLLTLAHGSLTPRPVRRAAREALDALGADPARAELAELAGALAVHADDADGGLAVVSDDDADDEHVP